MLLLNIMKVILCNWNVCYFQNDVFWKILCTYPLMMSSVIHSDVFYIKAINTVMETKELKFVASLITCLLQQKWCQLASFLFLNFFIIVRFISVIIYTKIFLLFQFDHDSRPFTNLKIYCRFTGDDLQIESIWYRVESNL